MSFDLSTLRSSRDTRPPRVLLYGVPGVGKTTFAAEAPNPVFIWTEEGAGELDVQGFPLAQNYGDVHSAIASLYTEEHDFKTVVIDSLSSLEPLVWQHVCQQHGVDSIEKVLKGFGKGYVEADKAWADLLAGLDALRSKKNMGVILIAHSEVKRFDDPRVESFDRYTISVHKRAAALLQKHSDIIGFAGFRVMVHKDEAGGFDKARARGVGSGDRLLSLEERPAFIAKNRYKMPAEIPLSWAEFAAHVPTLNSAPVAQEK